MKGTFFSKIYQYFFNFCFEKNNTSDFLFNYLIIMTILFRMFSEEVEKARLLNTKLSFGIGIFQGSLFYFFKFKLKILIIEFQFII